MDIVGYFTSITNLKIGFLRRMCRKDLIGLCQKGEGIFELFGMKAVESAKTRIVEGVAKLRPQNLLL